MVVIGVFECGIDIGFVDFDNGTDKLFEAVKNGVAQFGSQLGGFAFTSESAIDDGGRNAFVARVEIGDANAEDSVIEFVERIVVVESVGVGDFVNGEQVAELFVIFLFDDSAAFVGDDHAVIFFLFETVDDFAEFEVGDDTFLDGVDLYIFHKKSAPLGISG